MHARPTKRTFLVEVNRRELIIGCRSYQSGHSKEVSLISLVPPDDFQNVFNLFSSLSTVTNYSGSGI